MAALGTAFVDVKGDFSPLHRQVRSEAGRTKSTFRTIGRAATLGIGAGFAGAALVIKKSVTEMRDAEKVGKQTRAALKSTGGAANVSAKEVERLAESLSLKAGKDDEAIQSAENLLLTFTKVRNEVGKGNDIFNQGTRAVVDMSAALGQDFKSSAIQLGKALNDPVKGITALQRVGVTFDQQQRDRVAKWVEEGKQLKAQKFILREISKEFGGSAEAQADGFDRIQVAVDNLFESLGQTVGPELEKFANRAANFLDQMRKGTGAGGRFADQMKSIGEAVLPVARNVGRAAKAIGEFAAKHPQITTIAASSGLIAAAFAKFKVGKGLSALFSLVSGKGGLGGGGVLSKATPVPVFVTNAGFAGGPGGKPGGPVVAPGPGSRVPVPSAPKTPFQKLPAGVRGAVGSTAIGLGAVKIATDFFKDKSDLGLLDQFAGQIERVAKAGDAGGMRKLAGDLRAVADANKDQTQGKALRAFADELDRTAKGGGKNIRGLASLFDRLPKITGGSLAQVGRNLNKASGGFERVDNSGTKLAKSYRKLSTDTNALSSRTSSLAGTFEKGKGKSDRFGGSLKGSGRNAGFASDKVNQLIGKVNALPSKKSLTIEFGASIAQSLRDVPGLIGNLLAPVADNLSNFRRNRRRGGGMVPAMLSPGEVGITPDGGAFRVPGARVAADSVPALLPNRTAILTGDGQRKARRGMGLRDIIRKQLPHFRKGGFARTPINVAAAAAEKAKFKGQTLLNMLAIAGRESSWNPRATNFKPPDHSIGLWQINQLAHKGRFGSDAQLMDPLRNAKAAKSLFDSSGYSPWVSVQFGNATQYLDEAKRAVEATKGRVGLGPGGTKVTPSPISHPLLGTQLRPLVDDALLGGIQAGMDRTGRRGRTDLLQQVLEGIVPESTDRATRERTSSGGTSGGGGATGAIASRIATGKKWLDATTARGLPYQYAGGHGAPAVGTPSFDCSGLVSGGLFKMGLLKAVLDTVGLSSWGLPGKGKNVTVGVRGGAGKTGHTAMQVNGSIYEAGGSGVIKSSSWPGTFTTWRHPGWRKGGMVGMRKGGMIPPTPEGQRHLEKIARRKNTSVSDLLNPKSKNFVGFGLRAGGVPGGVQDMLDRALHRRRPQRRRSKRGGQEAGLFELIQLIGQDQLGSDRAQTVTRRISGQVQGRSTGALVGAQKRIKAQIRKMAKKGFTGPERIRTRRLRGALSLVQDAIGRPIGRALGGSDRLQELIDRRSSTLSDRLTVMGVDPESKQGLQVQQQEAREGLFRLAQRRGELQKALKRARKSGNKTAVRQVQAEISEVDDQMLGLQASIINLDKTMQQTEADAGAEALERIAALLEEQKALQTEQTNQLKRNEALITSQGPALVAGLTAIVNGDIGGRAGLGRSFPGSTGLGGLANL